jgi:nitrogen regulatory protein P-II 1
MCLLEQRRRRAKTSACTVKRDIISNRSLGAHISEVRGHGRQKGHKEIYRGMEYQEVVRTVVSSARTGKIGDGKVFVFDVAEAIRVRDDDRGEGAL